MDIKERLIGLLQDGDNPVWCWFPDNAAMVELVDYLLANDVTITRHGQWLHDSESDKYFCSACHEQAISFKKGTLYGGDLYYVSLTDYCPSCGAKMTPNPPEGE